MAHQGQEMGSCEKTCLQGLQASRRATCACPASHCYRQWPTERSFFCLFLNLGNQSTSNSCRINDVKLSRALTVYSVFSKSPLSWFNYCLHFTKEEAGSPGPNNRQKVTQGETGNQDLPHVPASSAPQTTMLHLVPTSTWPLGPHPSCWLGPLHSWLLAQPGTAFLASAGCS